MSVALSWCLFGALIVAFITFLVLVSLDDIDSYEAEDRDWLGEDE